jgi:hypothetical protein
VGIEGIEGIEGIDVEEVIPKFYVEFGGGVLE